MANRQVQRVILEVAGPLNVFPEKRQLMTRTDATFTNLYTRLSGGVAVCPHGLDVRSTHFNENRGTGFSSLSDATVGDFIAQFQRPKAVYKVVYFWNNARRRHLKRLAQRRRRRAHTERTIKRRARELLRRISGNQLQGARAEIKNRIRDGTWTYFTEQLPNTTNLIRRLLLND